MKESPIQQKSFAFSLVIIKLYQELQARKEFVISKQLLRSGTSIGANVEEATAAQSRKDFYPNSLLLPRRQEKQNIGSDYWLNLI